MHLFTWRLSRPGRTFVRECLCRTLWFRFPLVTAHQGSLPRLSSRIEANTSTFVAGDNAVVTARLPNLYTGKADALEDVVQFTERELLLLRAKQRHHGKCSGCRR